MLDKNFDMSKGKFIGLKEICEYQRGTYYLPESRSLILKGVNSANQMIELHVQNDVWS